VKKLRKADRADAVCDVVEDDRFIPAVAEEWGVSESDLARWVAVWLNARAIGILRESDNYKKLFGRICPRCFVNAEEVCEDHRDPELFYAS